MEGNKIFEEEEAKKLAAGPLGKVLSKYPLLFAKAAFFGQFNRQSGSGRANYLIFYKKSSKNGRFLVLSIPF
ncbi:MAG: hypothetical protein BA867_11190 [Desulfobacterales bacterium S5133MH16]|nr:MAG: hypothetical protein BA867_11190 [Desulfobacterales bacterium S5133MH16]